MQKSCQIIYTQRKNKSWAPPAFLEGNGGPKGGGGGGGGGGGEGEGGQL